MEAWLAWIYALMQTSIEWLNSMTILNVSVLWILGAVFVMGVLIRAFLFKA